MCSTREKSLDDKGPTAMMEVVEYGDRNFRVLAIIVQRDGR